MKKLFIILTALVLAALIALKITSRKAENGPQSKQEAQPTKTTRQLRPRQVHRNPASVGTSDPQTQTEDAKDADLILFTNWDDKIYQLRRVVMTNYSVRSTGTVSMLYTGVVPVGAVPPARVPSPEEEQAARQKWRQDLREKAEYKDIFAKEDEWKEKAKALEPGLTMTEAIKTMGAQPTSRINMPGGQTLIYYSPDGRKDTFWYSGNKVRLPVEQMSVLFDSDGKLKEIDWH